MNSHAPHGRRADLAPHERDVLDGKILPQARRWLREVPGLPDLPLAIPPAVTDETAPRSLPVRCGIDWRKDPVLRRAGRLA